MLLCYQITLFDVLKLPHGLIYTELNVKLLYLRVKKSYYKFFFYINEVI